MRFRKFSLRAAGAAAALFAAACTNIPKYHPANGEFNDWQTYETKHFSPASGTVTAIDTTANTITIKKGKDLKVYPVLPDTRIIHESTDIPLAQVPLNQPIKFTLSQDGTRLLIVWWGTHTYEYHYVRAARKK